MLSAKIAVGGWVKVKPCVMKINNDENPNVSTTDQKKVCGSTFVEKIYYFVLFYIRKYSLLL